MEKIVVIGTGTMAAGIAAGFIDAGMELVILGRNMARAEAALAAARKTATALAGGAARAPVAAAVGMIDDWNDWQGVTWVIETVAEDFELKRRLFAALDTRAPAGVPIGSNSSGFPITRSE